MAKHLGNFVALCAGARRAGVTVELHVGALQKVRVPSAPSTPVVRRLVSEVRLSHESGKVIAAEPLRDIGDLDRGAGTLLSYVQAA